MKVCIGGTFNILHKGHKKLIDKAFETAGENGSVFIGVTKGEILKNKKFLIPFDKRVNSIKKYLIEKDYNKQAIIKPIYDIYGEAVDKEYEAIITSVETVENAKKINEKRIKEGIKPLKIITIDLVLAKDNKLISSTRIFNKEIDDEGKKLNK